VRRIRACAGAFRAETPSARNCSRCGRHTMAMGLGQTGASAPALVVDRADAAHSVVELINSALRRRSTASGFERTYIAAWQDIGSAAVIIYLLPTWAPRSWLLVLIGP